MLPKELLRKGEFRETAASFAGMMELLGTVDGKKEAFGAEPMNALAFDTHAFVKRLTAVGMPEAQAEVLAEEQVRLIDERLATKEDITKLGAATAADIAHFGAGTAADIAKLEFTTKAEIARLEAATKAEIARSEAATRADIARLEAATKADIARLEAATKADIARLEASTKVALAETKADILKWMFGSMGFQTIVILGAVFGLLHLFVH